MNKMRYFLTRDEMDLKSFGGAIRSVDTATIKTILRDLVNGEYIYYGIYLSTVQYIMHAFNVMAIPTNGNMTIRCGETRPWFLSSIGECDTFCDYLYLIQSKMQDAAKNACWQTRIEIDDHLQYFLAIRDVLQNLGFESSIESNGDATKFIYISW